MQNQIIEMRRIARGLTTSAGVYLMKDRLGQVIYVGKAKNLKKRVSSYFQGSRKFVRAQPKIAAMVEMVREIGIHETKNETEALLLEGKLIKQYRPRYNSDFTDDKQFLLLRVDLQNQLPRFRLCRNRKDDGAHYYGPFAQAGMLRSTLLEMRKKFGILLSDAKPVEIGDGRFRLYDDARAEIFAGHNETTVGEYRKRVEDACSFMEGRAKSWLSELREEMKKRAEAMDFERAADLRDLAEALARTIGKTRKFTRDFSIHQEAEVSALRKLGNVLGLAKPPEIIECFDVSHVSGTFVVASMVRFLEGKPEKKSYRRYKIRDFEGNDDFRAMQEVVGRRYGKMHKEGQLFPNLVIIDGGIGQVRAALKAFLLMEVCSPPLIGLAKKEETIVFPDSRGELKLGLRDPALRLLQRIRDEAHRFANGFNAELRSKKIRESILDDLPGLGKVRRHALIDHFGSLEKIKQASILEIQEIEGFGSKLAETVHRFLQKGQPG